MNRPLKLGNAFVKALVSKDGTKSGKITREGAVFTCSLYTKKDGSKSLVNTVVTHSQRSADKILHEYLMAHKELSYE
jgi:hypothetical protein